MRKLSKEEYNFVKEWMRKHENADELVFDQKSKLPLQAIYHCQFGTFEKSKREDVKAIIDNMEELIDKMEAF